MTDSTGWSVIADADLRALRGEVARLREALAQAASALKDDDDESAAWHICRAALDPVR